MATKNFAYDHPAYVAVASKDFAIAAGSGSASVPKFVAFTGLIAKSVTLKPMASGTSNDISSFIVISGTTTTTTALATIGSGVTTFTNVALPSTATNLLQGDTFYVVKGTDATLALGGEVECVVTPLANVTQ